MGTVAEELSREGWAEGKAEIRTEILVGLLRRRFGPAPAAVEARVRSAATSDLDAWLDTLLEAAQAKSLDEILA